MLIRISTGLCLGFLTFLVGCSPSSQLETSANGVVDEPLGARYSLGMTLWHLGHQAEGISAFHDYVRQQGLAPESFLPADALLPPERLQAILVEPEGLDEIQLTGWRVMGDYIASGAGDQGPTVTIPLRIAKPGLYRIWVGYEAWVDRKAVTSLRFYRAGEEHLGPLVQPDEFYDQPPATNGPAWHDLLVDLPAGDLLVKLSHVTSWWHGPGGHTRRHVDCLYLTEKLWAEPPSAEARQAWRKATALDGIQWNLTLPLTKAEQATWRWWQLRPVAWEEANQQPKLFALSRRFWWEKIETLAGRAYEEEDKPNYREPERQVVFNEDWNLIANPVRARRQIEILTNDVNREPSSHYTLWHDIGSAIEGLRGDGTFDTNGPYATSRGSWSAKPGELLAGYGEPSGTVTTRMRIPQAGTYHLWVRSHPTNLRYTAPWFGRVSVDGREAFTYHLEGKLADIWSQMGTVTLPRAGEVSVDFILDGAGRGSTYRRVHTLLLTEDPDMVPRDTIRPPWTRAQYDAHAREAGALPGNNLLAWVFDDPYVPLSQEVWADTVTRGRSWPEKPVPATGPAATLLLPRESFRAIKIGLRNLTDVPETVAVEMALLQKGKTSFPDAMDWRVVAFVPDGTEKQKSTSRENWHPFFLLRRPDITVPPLNVAGLWITVDTHGIPEGAYNSRVVLREASGREHAIPLNVHVSPVVPAPEQPVLVDGFTQPHEGEAYLQDFVDHGMNVWKGLMSRDEMRRWGFHLLRLGYGSTNGIPEWYAKVQSLGLSSNDYFVAIKDEPGGQTAEALRPFIDVAQALHEQAPDARVSFNPSEGAALATFEVLAPYCDFWIPYTKHVYAPHWDNPKKWEIFHPKPWMWYTTPCLSDKIARQPGIRTMPSQRGNCVGVAFFALNYPWRDQWDAGYEHISDASTMGAVQSRHGPVATIVWEHIREAKQAAELAMMVREKLGVKTFDEVMDPEMQRLIKDGSTEELLAWLERAAAR